MKHPFWIGLTIIYIVFLGFGGVIQLDFIIDELFCLFCGEIIEFEVKVKG